MVWYANPRNVTEDDFAAFDRILSPAERETLSRYHRWDDQREYGLAHALLRLQLGDHLELPPGELRIERTQWDKPYLAGPVSPVELDFSISHAHDCVASGICDSGGIGIDVESCDRDPGIDSIAGLCLTAGEQRSLQGVPADARKRVFMTIWTLKEAFLKAIGKGFSIPPTEVEFDIDAIIARIPRMVKGVRGISFSPTFHLFNPSSRHAGAVATCSRDLSEISISFRCVPIAAFRAMLSDYV
ncbi:MAG: 4'-phosphopantetheinyl transferase superfamily protein [Bacteroidota bacterium]